MTVRKTCDFEGWATRNDILCSDGRVIRRDAFKDCDGMQVPMVFDHVHDDIGNVLGHAELENRPQGVYAYCYLNNTQAGKTARECVQHGDVKALSIYANQLKQSGNNVIHGSIKELSLVLAGANPGAYIENVAFAHSDGSTTEIEDEAIIKYYDDQPFVLSHADEELEEGEEKNMADETMQDTNSSKTLQDIVDSMNEEQKKALYFLVGKAAEGKNGDSEEAAPEGEDDEMKHNVFDNDYSDSYTGAILSQDDLNELAHTACHDARNFGGSLKDSIIAHADSDYGITNIDYLFPDAKALTSTPEFINREEAWVAKVMDGTHHTPFSRVKSQFADITADQARAKGYMKGKLKKEEVFSLLKRTTDPQTIYKKQKLDRDDIIDITDFNVVAWVKGEMRIKLDEEIARAILVGDGRLSSDDDKISEDHIRPIVTDKELYTIKKELAATDVTEVAKEIVDDVVIAMDDYKGSGNPTAFMRQDIFTRCMLQKDSQGYRLYKSESELANAMMVKEIVRVPNDIMGKYFVIVCNLTDYNVGADKGGEVNMFDDFDIDYNQQKYLIETRCSGALVKPYSAIAISAKTSESTGA